MAKIITNVKKFKLVRRILAGLLIFAMSFGSFAAIVADNDASAFITKAEFQALKHSFDSQINGYLNTVDAKIDYTIANYLNNFSASAGVVTNYNLMEQNPYLNGHRFWNSSEDGYPYGGTADDPYYADFTSIDLSIWAPKEAAKNVTSGTVEANHVPLSPATIGRTDYPTWTTYTLPASLTQAHTVLYNDANLGVLKQVPTPVPPADADLVDAVTNFVVKQSYDKTKTGDARWTGIKWEPESRGVWPDDGGAKYGVWYTNVVDDQTVEDTATATKGNVFVSTADGLPKWLAGASTSYQSIPVLKSGQDVSFLDGDHTKPGQVVYNNASGNFSLTNAASKGAILFGSNETNPVPSWGATTGGTKGTILYNSADYTPAWLAKGSANRFLQMSNDATLPRWSNYALPNAAPSKYQLLYSDSTSTTAWVPRQVSADTDALKKNYSWSLVQQTNSSGTLSAPKWVNEWWSVPTTGWKSSDANFTMTPGSISFNNGIAYCRIDILFNNAVAVGCDVGSRTSFGTTGMPSGVGEPLSFTTTARNNLKGANVTWLGVELSGSTFYLYTLAPRWTGTAYDTRWTVPAGSLFSLIFVWVGAQRWQNLSWA